MIIEVDGYDIEADFIEYVSPVRGDPSWKDYIVTFKSGNELKILDNKRADCKPCMPREIFVKLWKEAKRLKEEI